ncbi:MAG TPA: M14 family zinc carboxypeptidase, partial [Nitrosospira sp.]|nr:M14 family zinc carboxypeptidase [Nitrosospira sp.]
MCRIISSIFASTTVLAMLTCGSAVAADPECSPFLTPPVFTGTVPSPKEVLGFPIGAREVTTQESDKYLDAVDASSARVVTGTAATSVEGRVLRYAIIGREGHVTEQGLADIRKAVQQLTDPDTKASEAAQLAAATPAILWVSGNVHGNEKSGADAALRVTYELSDRNDCVVNRILDNAIVVVLPIQNPDGREANTRRNFYGFDMNRDWFARTQPETDGKLELLRQYRPVLYIDAHEFGYSHYFFPPNADPVYHEVPDRPFDWINNIYGASIAAEMDRQKISYFHG